MRKPIVYDAVVFDMDGVIFDSSGLLTLVLIQ